MRRRGVLLGGMAGLVAGGGAAADEADRQWMTVRLGGQRYRLLRAIDDGASDRPDPSGSKREEILLRADLPDITPHVMKEEYQGRSPFLGAMVEILASSLASSPEKQATVTREDEARVMGRLLGVLFDPAHPERVHYETAMTTSSSFPAPAGSNMKFVTSPKPFQDMYPRVFFNGDQAAPSDILSAGSGECVQYFIYGTARFKVTYGEHLIATWASVKNSITSLFDRSKV